MALYLITTFVFLCLYLSLRGRVVEVEEELVDIRQSMEKKVEKDILGKPQFKDEDFGSDDF